MLSGELALQDLPEAFNAKMREYLGLQPPDVVVGVLAGRPLVGHELGYFPTYALGNVVSVQLWERAEADLGDLDEQFERGEFAPLREWLRENVHRHGRAFTPQELLQRVTGSSMDPAPYLALPRAEARGAVRRRRRLTARRLSWRRGSVQTGSPSGLRSNRRPQRAQVGGRMRALTSRARIRVAQRNDVGDRGMGRSCSYLALSAARPDWITRSAFAKIGP